MKQKKKNIGAFRVILIVLIAAAVIFALFLALKKDAASRLWGTLTKKFSVEDIYYNNASGGSFMPVGDGFAVLSSGALNVYNGKGEAEISQIISFSYPAMDVNGDYGIIYDIGGNTAIFFSDSAILKKFDTDNTLISASVSEKGYICLCTEERGYGGVVTVYDKNGTAIYKWLSGSSYVMTAKVKGVSELLVITIGTDGGGIVTMPLTSEEETARITLPDVILDADFTGSGITAVTENGVLFYSQKLEIKDQYSFDGRYMSAFSMEDDYVAVILSDYQIGKEREIITVQNDGEVEGSLMTNEAIDDLDTCDDKIAVLYQNSLAIYDRKLNNESVYEGVSGFEDISILDDRSFIAAGAYSAHIFSETKTEN